MGEKIIELLRSTGNYRNLMQVFYDWTAIMAINITNSANPYNQAAWLQREREYRSLISKYGYGDLRKFVTAMSFLKEELNNTMYDVLGKIYCSIGANNTDLKQFFTPDHAGSIMAELAIDYSTDKPIHLVEPCCGSGSITISAINAIKANVPDYRHRVYVTAQDIDINCVYMIYVQLSLLGVKAVISHGNFPDEEPLSEEQIFYTPEYIMYAAEKAGLIKAENHQ